MSNFAFNNPAFKQQDPRNVATYPGGPQAAQGAQNAPFQHGTMDAAAVQGALQRHLTMPGSTRKAEMGPVTDVVATGPLEVTIRLSEPFAPLLAALLICFIGAVVSAFASTTGILGALIPLAVPFLLTGQIGAVGVVIALAISSSVVDISPFSTNGALCVASASVEIPRSPSGAGACSARSSRPSGSTWTSRPCSTWTRTPTTP